MKKKVHIALHWQILIGIGAGIIFGLLLPNHTGYIKWMGDLFLNALNMVVIPLIFSAIFIGVAGMQGSGKVGKVLGKTLSYYFSTTFIAIVIGLILVVVIRPGIGKDIEVGGDISSFTSQKISLIDHITGIVPSNVFKSMAEGNLLPIIFFAIILGIFSLKIENRHFNLLKDFFTAFYELIMKVTMFIIKLAPYGIFSVVACMVGAQAENPESLLGIVKGLGMFVLTVWAGCLIQGLIVLPLSIRLLGKENPVRHARKVSTPLITAFTTCSSSATLPLSIKYSQEQCGISEKISTFTLSLGSTINMNGTALFECVSALFIAQVYGIDMTLGQQITIVLTSLLAAVGSAGIPMAGIVMMTVVFNAVGLPLEGIGMILAVQQLCEMPRTCLNVYGDLCGAVVIAKSEGEKLTI